MKCYEKNNFTVIETESDKVIYPSKSFVSFQIGKLPVLPVPFGKPSTGRKAAMIETLNAKYYVDLADDVEAKALFAFMLEQTEKAEAKSHQDILSSMLEKMFDRLPGMFPKPSATADEPNPFDDLGDTTLDD